jgi:protein arginine kinase
VTYAFHERWGYLTACPTNVGTGMRVSVMLHLPALVITRQIEKVFRSLHKISLAVRGLYGEGSQAMGDFYQISNQITLGRGERELIAQVSDVVPVLIDYERRARDFLVRESQKDLHDRVSRAYGILCTAQTISSEETMHLLSSVRMGVNLGLIEDLENPTINQALHPHPTGPPAETARRPCRTLCWSSSIGISRRVISRRRSNALSSCKKTTNAVAVTWACICSLDHSRFRRYRWPKRRM